MRNKITLLLICSLGISGTSFGATYYVAPSGTDANTGAGWSNPFATISHAVGQGDVTEILVSNGTYVLTSQIYVNKPVIIRSWKGPEGDTDRYGTVIDGNYPNTTNRCFELRDAGAVVDGFTISNGYHNADGNASRGGGVYIYNGGMLTNCWIVGNVAEARSAVYGGGGVYILGVGSVWNCEISGNRVTNPVGETEYRATGGGVLLRNGGGVVANSFIHGNRSTGYGCGGFSIWGGGTIQNTVISNNSDRGGGVFGIGLVTNCLVINNTHSLNGAGLQLSSWSSWPNGEKLVTDCLISNNTILAPSTSSGGGIATVQGYQLSYTNFVIRNSTIISNTAGRNGGGIYLTAGVVENCVIVGNKTTQSGDVGGGGICANALETNMVFIRDVTVSSNQTFGGFGGGGIALFNARLENSVISDNNSYSDVMGGGGVLIARTSTVVNCYIINNTVECRGGGIHLLGGKVYNCIVKGNTATDRFGGGIMASSGIISSCTVIDNEVQGTPGAQRGAGLCLVNPLPVYNCIVWSNRWSGTIDHERDIGFYHYGTPDYEALSNSFHYTCSSRDFSATDQGNTTNHPMFVDSAAGNFRLKSHSPCVNRGTNQDWMTNALDLDGYPRIDRMNRQVDMGCYERVPRGMMFRSW